MPRFSAAKINAEGRLCPKISRVPLSHILFARTSATVFGLISSPSFVGRYTYFSCFPITQEPESFIGIFEWQPMRNDSRPPDRFRVNKCYRILPVLRPIPVHSYKIYFISYESININFNGSYTQCDRPNAGFWCRKLNGLSKRRFGAGGVHNNL